MNYSQNSEQQVIVDYFAGHVGRYLDIGAFTGVEYSNTLRLIELGWSGVAIEPDPRAFAELLDHYDVLNVNSVQCVCAALAPEPGMIDFCVAMKPEPGLPARGSTTKAGCVSTTDLKHVRKWVSVTKFRPMTTVGVTIREIMDRFGSQYDMVSVDAEGTSVPLLMTLPLDEMETRLVCCEHDGRQQDVRAYCAKFGLTKELCRNAENVIIGK